MKECKFLKKERRDPSRIVWLLKKWKNSSECEFRFFLETILSEWNARKSNV